MYIYGRNAVRSYLEAKRNYLEIYLQEGFKDATILPLIPTTAKVQTLSIQELGRLLGRDAVHQGIALKVPDFKYTPLEALLEQIKDVKNPILVMLDGVQDPQNLGAIVRTCDALGINGIIIPENRSVSVTPSVVKVSTGALDYVPVTQVVNLTRCLQQLKKLGYWVVGAEANNSVDYRGVDYNSPLVVVLGSEGKGISRLVLEQCDFKVKLPMCGHVNSLNVSVATAVLLYQIYNFRNPNKEG